MTSVRTLFRLRAIKSPTLARVSRPFSSSCYTRLPAVSTSHATYGAAHAGEKLPPYTGNGVDNAPRYNPDRDGSIFRPDIKMSDVEVPNNDGAPAGSKPNNRVRPDAGRTNDDDLPDTEERNNDKKPFWEKGDNRKRDNITVGDGDGSVPGGAKL